MKKNSPGDPMDYCGSSLNIRLRITEFVDFSVSRRFAIGGRQNLTGKHRGIFPTACKKVPISASDDHATPFKMRVNDAVLLSTCFRVGVIILCAPIQHLQIDDGINSGEVTHSGQAQLVERHDAPETTCPGRSKSIRIKK